MKFVNRTNELNIISETLDEHGMVVMFGRRRVGKTAIIKQLEKKRRVIYSQAIEGPVSLQISQILADFSGFISQDAEASSWKSLLALISMQKESVTVVIDEFPYLVKADPTLPSLLQKWLDHSKPDGISIVLLGSSCGMMHNLFLDASAPLYGRANRVLNIAPLNYQHFCLALERDMNQRSSMVLFSLVGGVPQYWKFAKGLKESISYFADALYFGDMAVLADEPDKLLKDEGIHGQQARAILTAVGRGSTKASEIAAKLGVQQTSLSKPLQLLMDTSLIQRILPFSESVRSTKRTFYKIRDVAMRFWFEVFSPHQSRWHLYGNDKKIEILEHHASQILEDVWLAQFPDACRYWEGDMLKFDCVRYADESCKSIIISEIKWKHLSIKEKTAINENIKEKFARSHLAKKFSLHNVEVMSFADVMQKM